MLGVCTRAEALQQAEDAGLDLVRRKRKRDRAADAEAHCAAADVAHCGMRAWQVMISPEADPPVCRIVDYSKFRYEQARAKAQEKAHLCGCFSAAR